MSSRNEQLLEALLNGEAANIVPQSRNEELLLALLNGETPSGAPQSRMEALLYAVAEQGLGGGGGVVIKNQPKTITENGTYRHDTGYTGLGTVTVNVPQEDPVLQDKTVTENGTVTADAGFDGLGVVTVNVEASGGGDDATMLSIINKSIETFSNDELEKVGDYAFWACTKLANFNAPNVTRIGVSGFHGCTSLQEAHFPKVTDVANSNEFNGCKSLVSASFPALVRLACVFTNCTALKNVDMPLVEFIGNNVFSGCTALEELTFPNVATVYNSFANCSKLKKVDFHKKINFAATLCFSGCACLNVLILRAEELTALSNVSVFTNTPFASGGTGGTVYCPAALIPAYQTATNWATLYAAGTCNFVAIEGSEYE